MCTFRISKRLWSQHDYLQSPTPALCHTHRPLRMIWRAGCAGCRAGVAPGRKCNIALFARASQIIAGRTRISTNNALASHTQHHGIGGIPPLPRKTAERASGTQMHIGVFCICVPQPGNSHSHTDSPNTHRTYRRAAFHTPQSEESSFPPQSNKTPISDAISSIKARKTP